MNGGPDRPGVAWGGLPSPALLRAGIGLLLGALVATLGAFVLGEYQFDGLVMVVVAGLLFGLIVAEVVVEVGRRRTVPVAVLAGAEAVAGLVWAGWISAGEGLEPISGGAWLAGGLGFVTALARTVDWRNRRAAAAATSAVP